MKKTEAGKDSMRRVLVTGLSGFIGKHMIGPLIQNGFEIHALTRQKPVPCMESAQNIVWHFCSVFERDRLVNLLKMLNPAFLLHLSWDVENGYLESVKNYDWVWASFELLRSFVENGGKRAVFAGTCFEYDVRYGCCSEALTSLRPSTIYGTCKNILRQLSETYCIQYNVEFAWGRIFYPFGPGEKDDRFFPVVIKSALSGSPIQIKTAQQFRDFVYVEDVAEIFVELLGNHYCGPVNVASGVPRGRSDVARSILAITDSSSVVDFKQIENGEPDVLLADVTQLRSVCRYRPIEFEVGLQKTINYWRDR
jgi:nucleoside-diphosphate-sugar epimerase